eukprot:9028329-Alexandrium_andersonii.AAC.1
MERLWLSRLREEDGVLMLDRDGDGAEVRIGPVCGFLTELMGAVRGGIMRDLCDASGRVQVVFGQRPTRRPLGGGRFPRQVRIV